MKKTSLSLIILAALSVSILAACSGGGSAALAGEWTLVSYGDASNPTPALPDVETSISFGSDGQFGGNVGCNSFSAGYTVNGDQLVLEPITSTLMACAENAEQESVVLGILSGEGITYQVNGTELTITSADGASVVVLARK